MRSYLSLLLLYVVSLASYRFTFMVQENFYGEANMLIDLYNLAGPLQLSLTSICVFCYVTTQLLLLLLVPHFLLYAVKWKNPWNNRVYRRGVLFGLTIAAFAIYAAYEHAQAKTPSYPDNYSTDVFMALLGYGVLIFVIQLTQRT